jgi:hypothetical protein
VWPPAASLAEASIPKPLEQPVIKMILFMVKLFNQANLKLQGRILRNLFSLLEGR